MEHVLEWEVFKSGFGFQQKYENPIGSGKWLVTPTNVAHATNAYPMAWKVFSPEHEILYLNFDLLHNPEHAHILMKHIYNNKGPRLLNFASNLLGESIEPIDGNLPWLHWMDITLRTWEPERICRAAYEAVRNEYAGESKNVDRVISRDE